ncbi:MAG: (2Fe-2S) ferredoxin domain-containing protein, partial [Spirochaetes bacterium]
MRNKKIRVKVGYGACGIAAGAADIYEEAEKYVNSRKLDVKIEKTG